VVLAACLTFGAILSVTLGQDISWDKQNYHLYNAWAFLHDRYGQDVTPAGMQSYFNPLPDLPYFLLANGPLAAWPRWMAAIQGLWFGALTFLVLCIARRLALIQGRRFGVADICAALIGASGTMAISQVGSTSNETQMAVLVLLGFYLLMPLSARDATPPRLSRALWAGLCCGVAAGLKPTATLYVPTMGLALLLAMGVTRKAAWQATFLYAMGCGVAFLVAYGAWGWHLYRTTGNPIFPLFNQWFQSPMTAAVGGTDGRFRPHNLEQWLFYPFFWIKKQYGLVTEVTFADRRYALAMMSVVALAVAPLFRRSRATSGDAATTLLVVFVSAGYVLWLVLFSILRYAIPLEVLTGLLMLCAMRAWWPSRWTSTPPLAQIGIALLLVLVLRTTTYPDWWRGPYTHHVVEVEAGEVEPHSLVILAGNPNGFVAPWFPQADSLQFVGVTWFTRASQNHGLWTLTQQRLTEHTGPIYVVRRNDADAEGAVAIVREMLPGSHVEDCSPVRSNMATTRAQEDVALGLSLCRLLRG
jgi:hypothetical protein